MEMAAGFRTSSLLFCRRWTCVVELHVDSFSIWSSNERNTASVDASRIRFSRQQTAHRYPRSSFRRETSVSEFLTSSARRHDNGSQWWHKLRFRPYDRLTNSSNFFKFESTTTEPHAAPKMLKLRCVGWFLDTEVQPAEWSFDAAGSHGITVTWCRRRTPWPSFFKRALRLHAIARALELARQWNALLR